MRDRPNLKPIAPRRLLEPVSMPRDLCCTSGPPESQHHPDKETEQTNEIDVEIGSDSGNMGDYTISGMCLV